MKRILLIFFMMTVAVVSAATGKFPQKDNYSDTLRLRFEPLKIDTDDKKLVADILAKLNKKSLDGEKYHDAKVIFLPDNAGLKILNVYGEVTGGATYNPFAISYIVRGNSITDSPMSGEIFRVDVLKNGAFLLYFDDYWRLGSNFSVYDTRISNRELVGYPTSKHGNYLFDCLSRKSHSVDSLPKADTRKNDEDLIAYLGLDKVNRDPNSYYWYDEERFLSRISSGENDYIEPVCYYRHTNGDIFEKVLRIGYGEKAKETILAKSEYDSDAPEMISTEFINDSIFREYRTVKRTVEDLQDLMAYEIDSTVTDFKYDKRFNFEKSGEQKFHYRIEQITKNNSLTEKRITSGKAYKLNGLNVQEKFLFEKDKYESALYYILIDANSKNEILKAGGNVYSAQEKRYSGDFENHLTDVNLDGYQDFKLHNESASGSAGDFEDVYIYDPKLKKFEHSEVFSGYTIAINPEKRIVSHFGKSGYWNFVLEEIRLGKRSQLLFRESFTCSSKDDKLLLQYVKSDGKKVLKRKEKTIAIDSVTESSDAINLLKEMAE